jgi:transglutaminase-like putative cysteine protease
MPIRYDITHTTVYRYRTPVRFGEHRVIFRPRDSHDLRVLATDLQVSPAAEVRLIQDPHSNSVALVQPLVPAEELRIVCRFRIEHAHTYNLELPLAPSAEFYPFAYTVADRFDLELYLRPHHDDPDGELTAWARRFIRTDGPTRTRDLLVQMNQHIREHFRYAARDEEGVQTPIETLRLGSGSCRDFALLMMEAGRRLGVATRFVSGYLYDPALDDPPTGPAEVAPADAPVEAPSALPPGSDADAADAAASAPAAAPVPTVGAGATHAWMQAYLPGAGWVPFDPTNNLLGGTQLIRVGVARDPSQVAPVSGCWFGEPDAYTGMEVTVQVRQV